MGIKRNIGELSRDKRKKREIKPTVLIQQGSRPPLAH